MSVTRFAFGLGMVLLAASVAATYAAAPGPTVVGLAKFPVNVKAGDYDLVNQVIDVPPGGMVPKHTHPGPAVVQVLTGSITLVDAMGQKTVDAGHMFTENPGTAHSAANNGSVPVRVSVSYLVPRGADLITFVK